MGGGASSLPVLWRKHVASTVQARGAALVPLQVGGGACCVAPVVALPTLRSHPRWSPRRGVHGACSLWARSCGPSRTLSPLPLHPAALSSGGDPRSATVIPHPRGGGGMWGGVFSFGAPIPLWSGTSPASLAGRCRPGVPPYVAVLVPASSLSSPGTLVCFVLCFFFFVSTARRPSLPPARRSVLCPPPCPLAVSSLSSPLSWVGGGEGGAGGGASSLSVLWRKHVASRAQARGAALVPLQGGGGLPCGSRRRPSYPAFAPPVPPPRWGLHGACFLRARSCGTSRTLSPLPPHLAALSSGGGGCPPLPTFILHPWGGGGVWGGGGAYRLPFVARMSQARRKHGVGTRRGTCPSAGGGACLVAPVVALPTLRSHPRWSPRWGLHGACSLRARSCGPSRTLSPLPPHPAALSSGGGRFSPPPLPASPTLGGAEVCEGGGGPCRLPFVARTSQARGAALVPLQGGGACRVSPVVAPPTLHAQPRGGGGVCGGGGGRPCRRPFVARRSQARRKHDASTG